ncbi:hypothetical protein [Deinococcus sp. ME38]|uniref:hypothetical protein n=1 Tax=Deinococcus sp. ME38 TaxID=3400344 RepID=UPI003B5A7445
MESSDFPTIGEVARQEVCDFQLPPFDLIVQLRVAQVLDARVLELELTAEDVASMHTSKNARLYAQIREAVETAYRLGMKDGLTRLGELA